MGRTSEGAKARGAKGRRGEGAKGRRGEGVSSHLAAARHVDSRLRHSGLRAFASSRLRVFAPSLLRALAFSLPRLLSAAEAKRGNFPGTKWKVPGAADRGGFALGPLHEIDEPSPV